mmetsp:Transcript_36294/g.104525  ORF Transcript_36294/g.104525 Transcript_36294/m.104525 type:complete len:174 (+) Transcript_36294:136-657(+)
MTDFDQQNIGNTVWSVARLPVHDRPLLDALSSAAIATISLFGAQGLSNTAWALATLLDHDHGPLLDAIAARASRIISDFDSQALGNTSWAFARLLWPHGEPLLQAISAAALPLGVGLHRQSHASLVDVYGTDAAVLARRLEEVVASFVLEGMVASGWRPAWGSELPGATRRLG